MKVSELTKIKNDSVEILQKYNTLIVTNDEVMKEVENDISMLINYYKDVVNFMNTGDGTQEEITMAKRCYSFLCSAINISNNRKKFYTDKKGFIGNKQKELEQKRIENTARLGRYKEERYGKKDNSNIGMLSPNTLVKETKKEIPAIEKIESEESFPEVKDTKVKRGRGRPKKELVAA